MYSWNSSWLLNFILLWITIFYIAYKYVTRNFDYWKKRGVYNSKPTPFFGNLHEAVTLKTNLFEAIKKLYDETDEPFFGIFMYDQPALIIKSPKLIKNILIKDFNFFCNLVTPEITHNRLISNMLLVQKNEKWRDSRKKLTPLFTSHMTKLFFTELEAISQRLVEYIGNISVPLNAKSVAGHFSTEMIARCIFATDPSCFEPNVSKFRHCVKRIFKFSLRNGFIHTTYFCNPEFAKFFKLNVIPNSIMKYFEETFLSAMESRRSYIGKPMNVVDVVNDYQNKNNGNFPDKGIFISNSILFLTAGQESTSSIIAYALYELAMNPDIQEKLRNAIKENHKTYDGFTFEGIQKNKYLDMFINETLRKYAVLPFIGREAVADYCVEGTDLVIEKGTKILIPMYSIFRDPKYYPNPNKFDPERFAENNINMNELIYFPFGEGPRGCIGKRLGLIAITLCLSNIVLKFNIQKCEATPDQIEFEPKSLVLQSKRDLLLKLSPLP